MTPLKTNVLIADDHPIVLNGLRTVLKVQSDLLVVAQATDGEQALERARSGDRVELTRYAIRRGLIEP
jgi:DNA-binding NarL/FixJ family response regulator